MLLSKTTKIALASSCFLKGKLVLSWMTGLPLKNAITDSWFWSTSAATMQPYNKENIGTEYLIYRWHFCLSFKKKIILVVQTLRDRKMLPRVYLISCWGVKLFLPKDVLKFVRNWVVTIWVFEFCHNLSFGFCNNLSGVL